MELSIIIPVFNNSKTLKETLDSLIIQEFSDYEVIMINDGSTDGSQEIIECYCRKDRRFRACVQENKGVAAARNMGIEKARGKFITFVDGDDILPKDGLMHMFQITNIHDCDTVIGGYERMDGISVYKNSRSFAMISKSPRIEPDDRDLIHCWSLCNRWFSRKLIIEHNIRLQPFSHLEDGIFMYQYLQYAEKIYTCPYIVYTYKKPLPYFGRTTTQSVNKEMLHSADAAFNEILKLTARYGNDFRRELIYRHVFATLIGDYGNRIWKLDDNFISELNQYICMYIGMLDEERKRKILTNKSGLLNEKGLKSKKLLKTEAKITIIISEKVSDSLIKYFIDGIFDQNEVSFKVICDISFQRILWNHTFENMSFADLSREENMAVLIDTPYVAFIDRDMLYDHRSLSTMMKKLSKNDGTEFVSLMPKLLEGKKVKNSGILKYAYDNKQFDIDGFMANKLFRTEYFLKILEAHVGLYNDGHSVYLKKPSILFCAAEKEIIKNAKKYCFKQACQYLKNTYRKRIKSKIKQPIRKIRGIFSKGETDKRRSAEKQKKTLDYYLDMTIDEHAVLLEGLGKIPKGNMLYVLRELQKKAYEDFDIYYVVKNDTIDETFRIFEREYFERIKVIIAGSAEYKAALFSAKFLFNEVDFPNWWIKKPGQVYVNLWHGTPLKRLGKARVGSPRGGANASRNFTMADYILFPNEFTREHILKDCDVENISRAEGLMLGYPRTSQLFDLKTGERIRNEMGIKNRKIAVWMPTWNNGSDPKEFLDSLKKIDENLDDNTLIYIKMHHKTTLKINPSKYRRIKTVSEKYDIYEFLCAADMLITDYSSILFDFAVTKKRIILYCSDLEKYEESRGLYMDIDSLPFSVAKNVDDLIKSLAGDAAVCSNEYGGFNDMFNRFDSPENTEKLCEYILMGKKDEIKVESPEEQKENVFIVSDGFSDRVSNEKLIECLNDAEYRDNVYVSFTEEQIGNRPEQIEKVLQDAHCYCTKGKPLSIYSERERLFNNIKIKCVILTDVNDPKRISSFSYFECPVYLIVTDTVLEDIDNNELQESIKKFYRYGSGIYAWNERNAGYLKEKMHIQASVINSIGELMEKNNVIEHVK